MILSKNIQPIFIRNSEVKVVPNPPPPPPPASEMLGNYITEMDFTVDDQLDVITNALKKVNLFDKIIIPPNQPSISQLREEK